VIQGCPVIPVLLSNAPKQPELPVFLEGMTWVDFRRSSPEPMKQLIWGITGIKNYHNQTTEGAEEPLTTSEVLAILTNQLLTALTAGRWKEADQETWHILLSYCTIESAIKYLDLDKVSLADIGKLALDKVSLADILDLARKDELEKGYSSHLYIEDIYRIPGFLLSAINKLWVNSSGGHFGFSVQKEIYQSLGGWKAFAESVGWRRGGRWLSYRDLTFSPNAPKGHLPSFYIYHSHDELSSSMSLFHQNPLERLEETLRFPLDFSGEKRTREFNKKLRMLEESHRGRNFAFFVEQLANCDI
jgi:hypothetical protein